MSLVTFLVVDLVTGRLSQCLACRMSLEQTDPRAGLSLSLVGPVLRLAAGGDHDSTGT